MRNTKTLRNILATGTIGLSVGCLPLAESFEGEFRGYNVFISQKLGSSNKSLIMSSGKHPLNSLHLISAEDSAGDGTFEKISYDGMNIEELKPIREGLRNHPMYYYANQDSLKAAYDDVMEQNRSKGGKK